MCMRVNCILKRVSGDTFPISSSTCTRTTYFEQGPQRILTGGILNWEIDPDPGTPEQRKLYTFVTDHPLLVM